MNRSQVPEIVTIVAGPPSEADPATIHGNFVDEVFRALVARKPAGNRIVRAASVRDMERQISDIVPRDSTARIKLQLVGHSLSGALLLGAAWLDGSTFWPAAHNFPFYALTPDPMALGLLAPHASNIEEVMIVGCNVGSDSSYGYAMNGRTLTYALAELLRCRVRGADDLVSPEEFDARGWYTPGPHRRSPQGWQWVEGSHPTWVDGGPAPSLRRRAETVVTFEIRAITGTLLPVPAFTGPIELRPTLHVVCRELAGTRVPSALPEVSLETDQGPASLLCGGRYLRISDTYYAMEPQAHLSATLSALLWRCPSTEAQPASTALASAS